MADRNQSENAAVAERLSAPAMSPDRLRTSGRLRPSGRLQPPGAHVREWPVLWRVFAANVVVFVVALALLVLTPLQVHKAVRVDEVAVLFAGLAAMLVIDLMLLRRTLAPLAKLARVMGTIDLRRPGQRAVGFERSGDEVATLAGSFNAMLQRLEDERHASAARALAAQEAERRRVARELHDGVGQSLTAVVMRAEHAAGRAVVESVSADVYELAEIVKGTLDDIRRISRELRPEALEDLGLVNALIALCNRVGEAAAIAVRRAIQAPLPVLSPEVELALYRIVQEALTNVARHARASQATVSLALEPGELVLAVADDGRGLSQPHVDGAGLGGMRERAMLIGARLDVGLRPTGGTVVTLRLPTGGEGR